MKDLSPQSGSDSSNNVFSLRDSLGLNGGGAPPMNDPRGTSLRRQQVLSIIQDVLAILDEDEDFGGASSSSALDRSHVSCSGSVDRQ
jgi:hypothetical protein